MTTAGGDKALTAGQVLGGRWRPLQYFFAQSLYSDLMATCGKGNIASVKRCWDYPENIDETPENDSDFSYTI